MLIVGAKGFAKEVLETVYTSKKNIAFYDDINNINESIYDQFIILKSENEAKKFFAEHNYEFTIGIGNPTLRFKLFEKFEKIGGVYTSTISESAKIGSFDVSIGEGSNILANSIFSNSTKIGMGGIVYYNVIITHDCNIGNFVELSPNATILGGCMIGDFTHIGANATILPKIKIGSNVIVGAGSVVTKDIPDNCVVAGMPAKIIKKLSPLSL